MKIRLPLLGLIFAAHAALAQTAPSATPAGPPPNTPPRRPVVQTMTLTSPGWKDGGMIPAKYAQPGHDTSPALAWSNVPEGTQGFVLIVRDLDSITPAGADNFLHWMLWNIPKDTRSIPEAMREGGQLPDGLRQISGSGPYYRGPAAPASGPAHHYAFELYAVSAPVDVPALGQSPAQTKAAVESAMAGKILGKGVLTGLFKRG